MPTETVAGSLAFPGAGRARRAPRALRVHARCRLRGGTRRHAPARALGCRDLPFLATRARARALLERDAAGTSVPRAAPRRAATGRNAWPPARCRVAPTWVLSVWAFAFTEFDE
jgi:hypothetical protein